MIRYNTKEINIGDALKKLYSTTLIMAPILCIYGIGISTITFFDFLLFCLNIIMIFQLLLIGKIKIFLNIIPYGIYVFITMIFNIDDSELVLRSLRYIFYIVNIIIFVKNYFDYDISVKVYQMVARISTIFLMIQIIASKLLGIYLPGVITSLPLVDTDMLNYSEVFQMAQVKRHMAFFAEPSHYAIFILGYFSIILFDKNRRRNISKFLFESLFLSMGLVLSTSILGMAVMIAMWIIWLIFNYREFILKPYMLIIIIVLFSISYMLLSDTTAFKYVTDSSVIGRQSLGRFDGYSFINSDYITSVQKVFGKGMSKIGMDVYLPSYPIIIFYFGYIGLILLISSFLPYILKLKYRSSLPLLVCMFGISIGSEILVGNFIMVFFPLIISSRNDKGDELDRCNVLNNYIRRSMIND